MGKQLSIRKFLLLNLLVTVITTVFITISGTYYFGNQEISDNLDNLLMEVGAVFHALIDHKKSDIFRIIESSQHSKTNASSTNIAYLKHQIAGSKCKAINRGCRRYLFQIWDRKGNLLIRSPNAPEASLIDGAVISDKDINGAKWRTLTLDDIQHGFVLVVAENHKLRSDLIHHLIVDDIYLILFIYPVSGLLVWLIVNRGLKSIRFFAKEVAQRAANRLDPVNLQDVPIEIIPLIDELNKLFLRLQRAFEREQRFAADAAHELHTPLAALRTQAQVALKTIDPKERLIRLQQVIAGVDRCTHVIQQLLTLCRLSPEAVTPEYFTNIDLAKIATEAIAQLVPSAIEKHIDIEFIPDLDCFLLGNATGLYALVRNLVDNAIRYTPAGGKVKAFIHNDPVTISLRVIDNGPGIPEELRSRVFERFFRVLGTQAQGSGLGLAITEQIANLHNGYVELGTPESGSGLEVKVTFLKVTKALLQKFS